MPPLSVLIKPASSGCNLQCSYCFYRELANNRQVPNHGIMTVEVLEVVVQKALQFAENSCSFIFQGGEPTLAGLYFYRRLLDFQNSYNTKGLQIHNAMQTNGIVIDAEWATFLAKNNFLIGLSLDGDKDTHNQNRILPDGSGSHKAVMKAAAFLDKADAKVNILSVINKNVARHPIKIYNFFKKYKLRHIQFIPCLDVLQPADYVRFLKTMFDLWHRDWMQGEKISIRYFDNLLGMLAGYPPEACGLSGVCICQYVIEADGSVYPCDFYAFDKWELGNILTDDFGSLATSPVCAAFIEESKMFPDDCLMCKWLRLCKNGCKRDRDESGKNRYCDSFKDFLSYTAPKLKIMH